MTASSPAQRLVLNGQKRAEKAEYNEPDVIIPSSRWLRSTMSEAVVEAFLRQAPFDKLKMRLRQAQESLRTGKQNLPTLVKRQAQKGRYPGYVVNRYVVTTRMDTGVKQQPKVTTHQSVERSNPLTALSLS